MSDINEPEQLPKLAIIFGGDGYIGRNLIKSLISKSIFDAFYVFDIKKSKESQINYDKANVFYINGDVRNKITIAINKLDTSNSWIFNFAAIHREPGHKYQEYFDTNIPGAKNINSFAEQKGIDNILFTSSIAPYGKSLHERTEQSNLYPQTAYGISKALAEKIHEKWLEKSSIRKLIIVRPSVIFGPKDPGNVYRMIKSLKKGTFVLPDGGKVIKGYGYIYGLIESMIFTIGQNKRHIIYNYAENPLVPLNEMVAITKEELGYKKPTLSLSVNMLAVIAFFLQKGLKLIGKKSEIHPVRVRKAGFPTNIKPEYLINQGFNFKYNFREALRHWKSISPEDFNS